MSYCGYNKIAENNSSMEYNCDKNSDNEGYKNEDIGDLCQQYQILILTLQILSFFSMGVVKFLVIILILG